jgi:uncharacterized protein
MPDFSTSSLSVLSRGECLRLLAIAPIGRIVFTQNALPAVRVVNFVLHGDDVVIRIAEGGKLLAAVRQAVVAFEADDVDVFAGSGWSVTVIGHAREVTEPEELAVLRGLLLTSWAPGPLEHLICVKIELVSGRRLDQSLREEKPA